MPRNIDDIIKDVSILLDTTNLSYMNERGKEMPVKIIMELAKSEYFKRDKEKNRT